MGLDDRIEAKRLEAMPEIVVERELSLQKNETVDLLDGVSVPVGVYAGLIEMEKVSPDSLNTFNWLAVCRIGATQPSGVIMGFPVDGTDSKQVYLYDDANSSLNTPAPFIAIKRSNGEKISVNTSRSSYYEVDYRCRVTLRKII